MSIVCGSWQLNCLKSSILIDQTTRGLPSTTMISAVSNFKCCLECRVQYSVCYAQRDKLLDLPGKFNVWLPSCTMFVDMHSYALLRLSDTLGNDEFEKGR